MSDYKIPYLLKTFDESDLIEDPDLIVDYLTDKYDNNNTINGYIFSIIRFVKENSRLYEPYTVKRAYRKYFNYINNRVDISDDEDDIKTKCLIVDDNEPVRPQKRDVRDMFKGSNDMPENMKKRRF